MGAKVWDGFDHYNDITDLEARSGFVQYANTPGTDNIFAGFIPGFSTVMPGRAGLWTPFANPGETQQFLQATWADRNEQMYIGHRASFGTSNGAVYVFMDTVAGAPQVSVVFNPNNFSIAVWAGAKDTGTLLYSSANNVWTYGWNFIEFGVNIALGSGFVKVQINNNLIVDLTAANTKVTANTWSDQLQFFGFNAMDAAFAETPVAIDDLYYFDTSVDAGPNPNNTFLGDSRTITSFPIGNDAVQFTPLVTIEATGGNSAAAILESPANKLSLAPFTVIHSGVLGTSVEVILAGAVTGDVILGIYDSDGINGTAGTLLAHSAAVVNPVSGANTFTMAATTTLASNHPYYWGINANAAVDLNQTGDTTQTWLTTALAYSGTFPSNVLSDVLVAVPDQGFISVSGTMTLSNAGNASEIAMDGDTSYNYDNTAGNEDLLNMQPLPAAIDLVVGVQITGSYRKDDAGLREVKQALKSGSTEVYGASYAIATSYMYFTDGWVLDPNTSDPWTATAVNAIAAGYNVAL